MMKMKTSYCGEDENLQTMSAAAVSVDCLHNTDDENTYARKEK